MIDKLVFGAEVTVVGLGVVFISLTVLWLITAVLFSKKKPSAMLGLSQNDSCTDGRLLAILTAACIAALEDDFEIKKITLIKERRITDSLWSFQGRLESMGQRISQKGIDV
ncbi:MAG: OadG family protein [Candidatus Wallbacteria bacterium]|nr:OadG family protein [Candidatus Wallbacteria bacterium]